MSKKKSTAKTVTILLLATLGLAALVGGSIAISKRVKDQASSSTPAVIPSNSEKTNSGSSSNSESSYSSLSPSSSTNQQENVVPTINCSTPQEVYWYNNEDQVDLNETLLVATLNGLPANATEDDKELYIWSDDDDLDEWIEISQTKNGNKVILSSPYVFHSGETLHLKQIKEAPATGFYKIPLWIYAVHYEPDQVYNCVDFWFIQS